MKEPKVLLLHSSAGNISFISADRDDHMQALPLLPECLRVERAQDKHETRISLSLVAVHSAYGFGGGVSRVLLDGMELPPSCALVVSPDLRELEDQWLACVQFFLMLFSYLHQKMIEASQLLSIVPPGVLSLRHDISLSCWSA